ncbi:hypothetical protein DPMN_135032 [Dreissena polymorpha]|uniref:Uncharacterized protein n=1 Tax=Dreissena polymorpha TaxID=45954 RepID=A0A9D4FXB7_DREPO|nr:hypothetical protein DPMN_135032 [Dreissena polymorpha]
MQSAVGPANNPRYTKLNGRIGAQSASQHPFVESEDNIFIIRRCLVYRYYGLEVHRSGNRTNVEIDSLDVFGDENGCGEATVAVGDDTMWPRKVSVVGSVLHLDNNRVGFYICKSRYYQLTIVTVKDSSPAPYINVLVPNISARLVI